MTAKTTLKTPRINHATLSQEIARKIITTEGADIHTRAQVRLDTATKEADALEREKRGAEADIAATRKNMEDLQTLLDRQIANVEDIGIELTAVLEQINSLRQSGVTL
jgi:predicted  nucleic acid-binding Zn-ribbon protein